MSEVPRKITTNVYLRKGDQILLAMKKRGFGAGKWNGAGGKAEPGETAEAAAIRECQEEIGVTPKNLQLLGLIDFYDDNVNHYCHMYAADEWDGEPAESEEMRPQWFNVADIPYDAMWEADHTWMPLFVAGKHFKGTLIFTGNTPIRNDVAEVDSLD